MSKDLIIAAVIVVACLAVTTVALVTPSKPDGARKNNEKPVPYDRASDAATATKNQGATDLSPNHSPFEALSSDNDRMPLDTGFDPSLNQPLPDPASTLSNLAEHGNSPAFPPTTKFTTNPIPEAIPAVAPEMPKTHVVASGETLGDISLKYYNTTKNWKKIAEVNKVDPMSLVVGQKLEIPVIPKPNETALPAAADAVVEAGFRAYTVKGGESYYSIAQSELGDPRRWRELQQLNKTATEELRPGQVIKLPTKLPTAQTVTPNPLTPPQQPGTGHKVEHIVAKGELLSDISTKYYGTSKRWRDIVQANPGLDPERLLVGQKINIPNVPGSADAGTATPMPIPAIPANTSVVEYTVKSGDTLESIAEHYYGNGRDWQKIAKANPGIDPSALRLGQKLKVPDVAAAAPAPVIPPKPPALAPIGPQGTPIIPRPSVDTKPATGTFVPPPSTTPNAFTPPKANGTATEPPKSTGSETDDVFNEFFEDEQRK
jgi:nucleoid-associated protein YgaU